MKKTMLVVLAGLLVTGIAFCQDAGKQDPVQPQGPQQQTGSQQQPAGRGMMGPGMMQQPQAAMVASGDGGVIVLYGARLMKYDKDLNLVKEVKLETGRGREMPGMGSGSAGRPQPPAGQNAVQPKEDSR